MTDIIQTVESALTNAEHAVAQEAQHIEAGVKAEAKKVEAAVEGCIEHVYAYVCQRCHQLKSDTLTEAEREAEEDAQVIEGAFMRFVRRVWAWL